MTTDNTILYTTSIITHNGKYHAISFDHGQYQNFMGISSPTDDLPLLLSEIQKATKGEFPTIISFDDIPPDDFDLDDFDLDNPNILITFDIHIPFDI